MRMGEVKLVEVKFDRSRLRGGRSEIGAREGEAGERGMKAARVESKRMERVKVKEMTSMIKSKREIEDQDKPAFDPAKWLSYTCFRCCRQARRIIAERDSMV